MHRTFRRVAACNWETLSKTMTLNNLQASATWCVYIQIFPCIVENCTKMKQQLICNLYLAQPSANHSEGRLHFGILLSPACQQLFLTYDSLTRHVIS